MLEFNQEHQMANLSSIYSKKGNKLIRITIGGIVLSSLVLLSGCGVLKDVQQMILSQV